MNTDSTYLQRCLQLAGNGAGNVAPNPLVGCVLVADGRIIGEGFHRQHGGPHAEVEAIRAVADPALLREATLYVNLEPCSHHGKTPPCADLIIEKGIPRVVIGTTDPHDKVAGKGIARLEAAGCAVTAGVLEQESLELNRRFFTFHQQQRPYIVLKWAQSADGYIDRHREPGDG
ncbi:MAG: bifunctional diaminohydroxyphosphoribosylaminopyrimidine deaminase/5-amino-6-(5-phosphoribosylamino)uracil reductase RibD, partial [Bacteroidota bacterium]